jgi:hypothetical protein
MTGGETSGGLQTQFLLLDVQTGANDERESRLWRPCVPKEAARVHRLTEGYVE